jgi:hypothetical protein
MSEDEYTGSLGEMKISSLKIVRDVFEKYEPLVEDTHLDDFDPRLLQVNYSEGFEDSGRFDVKWDRKNNYSFHYTEETLDFRYDRHPNDHSPEKHFHAPGDTQREDATTSCVEVEQDRLVAMAAVQLWRNAWEKDDLSLLNRGNPP